jgi:hypothetical protein
MLCIYLEGQQGIVEARKGDSGRRLIARCLSRHDGWRNQNSKFHRVKYMDKTISGEARGSASRSKGRG